MAQITTKNYNADNFSELVSDLRWAYNWRNVEIAEDSSSAIFYVTDNIAIQLTVENNYRKIKILKNDEVVTESATSNGYFITKTITTTKTFCFSYKSTSSLSNMSPNDSITNIIIGKAVNQFTETEETALANIMTSSSGASGYIISSDNLTESVSSNPLPFYNNNLGSKVTSIQNVFSKYSECIMKDVYVLSALQFPSLSFNDCTLNNKKYYMHGCILLADD